MMRSIVNCSRGRSSMATSVLVVVPRILARLLAGSLLARPPIAHRRADAGDCAIDVQHSGGDSEEEQHDDAPWPRAEPVIDRPSERGRETDRNHQLNSDAEAKTDTLLQGGTITNRRLSWSMLRARLVDPFTKTRQRVRRLALAHLRKRRTTPEARRNIVGLRNPVNEAPPLGISRFAAAAGRAGSDRTNQGMPFAAGAELQNAVRVEIRDGYRLRLVLDNIVVDPRPAAADQAPGFAVGSGEAGEAEELESGNAAGQIVPGHLGLRQFAAAAAAFEDRARSLGRSRCGFPAMAQHRGLRRQHLFCLVDVAMFQPLDFGETQFGEQAKKAPDIVVFGIPPELPVLIGRQPFG